VTVAPGEGLTITGPGAAALPVNDDNLCLRAARAMGGGVRITLDKRLPVASGIGGGSADAAATLQALARLWQRDLPDAGTVLGLGADVPVCLAGHPARMRGVGEVISPLPHALPPAYLVLANPRVQVSTPAVFRGLARKDNPPLPTDLPRLTTLADLAAFLRQQRNDLPPSQRIGPRRLQRAVAGHDRQRLFQIALALVALFDGALPEGALLGASAAAMALITGRVSLRSRKSSPTFLPITAVVPP
jgi:4-diphosphocytidyl-2C-methyl-D-erythritol kinase